MLIQEVYQIFHEENALTWDDEVYGWKTKSQWWIDCYETSKSKVAWIMCIIRHNKEMSQEAGPGT